MITPSEGLLLIGVVMFDDAWRMCTDVMGPITIVDLAVLLLRSCNCLGAVAAGRAARGGLGDGGQSCCHNAPGRRTIAVSAFFFLLDII